MGCLLVIENLNYYNVFHTVAKTGSISKAAGQLFISQPAVSKAINNLEKEIGAVLFFRNSRGVTLTDEGRILYDYIDRAIDNISKGEESLKKHSELGVGHISIGVSTSLCKHILLDYLKDFIKDNPHINVRIDCHSTLNTLKLLKNEEIDIGLICSTDLPKDIFYKPIQEIHDIFVTSTDYIDNFRMLDGEQAFNESEALPTLITGNIGSLISSNKKTTTTDAWLSADKIRDLMENSNLMVLEEANVTRTHIDNYLSQQGIHPSRILEINNMDLLIDFAAIGMGIAAVVKEFALDALNSGQIIELPLKAPIKERTVGFAYADSKNKSTALSKFIEYCGV